MGAEQEVTLPGIGLDALSGEDERGVEHQGQGARGGHTSYNDGQRCDGWKGIDSWL